MNRKQLALLAAVALLAWWAVSYRSPPTTPPAPAVVVPGDRVHWLPLPKQRDAAADTPFLADVLSHLPKAMGSQYYSSDKLTWAHETTHGINSHLRNTYKELGDAGFYVGHDQAAMMKQPKLTLRQVAGVVPSSLRGSRYQLYFVSQAGQWNDSPLYPFDEWCAYTNDATVGLEIPSRGSPTDDMVAPLEFAVYALCTCEAVDKYDPEYLRTNVQFREYVAHELRRSVGLYRKGIVLPQFKWDTPLEKNVRQDAGCASVLRKMYGDGLTLKTLFGE